MARTGTSRRYQWSGYLLGFALSSFFDGILLHQILQWHHLLSTINSDDIRFQVAAAGYFHVLMYVIAAAGLWLLWASRKDPVQSSGRLLFGTILIGFGVWHVVDTILSHWVFGIHRIRMDSPNPLFWDLLWLGLFGIVPLIIGWVMEGLRGEDGARVSRASPVVRSHATLLILVREPWLPGRRRSTSSPRCCSPLEPARGASSRPSPQLTENWCSPTEAASSWWSGCRRSNQL